VSYAVQAVGDYTKAVGHFSQGIAASNIADYNAAVARQNATLNQQADETEAQQADYNATIAEQDASVASRAAAFREQQSRLAFARQQGQNRAVIGASGVTYAGSPLQVLSDNALEAEKQALVIRYSGELDALANQRRAALFTYGGAVKRWQGRRALLVGEEEAAGQEYAGKMAKIASYFQVVGDIVSGASGGVGMSGGMGAAGGAGGAGGA